MQAIDSDTDQLKEIHLILQKMYCELNTFVLSTARRFFIGNENN